MQIYLSLQLLSSSFLQNVVRQNCINIFLISFNRRSNTQKLSDFYHKFIVLSFENVLKEFKFFVIQLNNSTIVFETFIISILAFLFTLDDYTI